MTFDIEGPTLGDIGVARAPPAANRSRRFGPAQPRQSGVTVPGPGPARRASDSADSDSEGAQPEASPGPARLGLGVADQQSRCLRQSHMTREESN